MKLSVLTDQNGKLIGTARFSSADQDVHCAFKPSIAHTIHEIDVPEECERMTPAELHERIRSQCLRGKCD